MDVRQAIKERRAYRSLISVKIPDDQASFLQKDPSVPILFF